MPTKTAEKQKPSPPKAGSAKGEIVKMSDQELTRTLAKMYPDQTFTASVVEQLKSYSRMYAVPVTAIMLQYGRPYVLSEGLNHLLARYCEDNRLDLVAVSSGATTEDGGKDCFESRATVILFDTQGFKEGLADVSRHGAPSADVITELRAAFTRSFSLRSGASKETVKSEKLHSRERLKDMAERRAINRAKREAVKLSIASDVELDLALEGMRDTEAKVVESEPIDRTAERSLPASSSEKIGDERIRLLQVRWQGYTPKLDKKTREDKLHALVETLFGKTRVRDLNTAEFDRVIELLNRGRIKV